MSIRRSNHAMRSVRTSGKLLTRAVGALLAAGLLCGTVTASVASAEETLQNPEISQGGVSGTSGNTDGAGAADTEAGNTGADGNTNTGNTGNAGEGTDSAAGDSADGITSDGASTSDTTGNETDSTANSDKKSDAEQSSAAAQADDHAFDKYIVSSDSPKNGTQVNLFDYWIGENRTDPDYVYDRDKDVTYNEQTQKWTIKDSTSPNNKHPWVIAGKNPESKINAGKILKFSPGDDLPNVNGLGGTGSQSYIAANIDQTPKDGNGKKNILKNMVKDQLGEDGYPVLNGSSSGETGITQDQSLNYLFNSTESEEMGKKAFMDTKGLLQVNEEGYYYYDSTENFASFDEASNNFVLYDSPAVNRGDSNGQFFPFNTASEVFTSTAKGDNGKLPSDVTATCPGSNPCKENPVIGEKPNLTHYFGVSMTTRFVQPENGMVQIPNGNTKPMTYEFTGDDDVWVYIDGKLVGDLGGIHNKVSLSIDFNSGNVTVDPGAGNAETRTLGEILGLSSKTFADNTFHTLKFFYLERGNVNSNMKLKFNLKTVPESDVIKVDQNGDPVEGAAFSLYATGNDYNTEGSSPIASGVTDVHGNLVLADDEGNLINFDEQYKQNYTTHYVLSETKAPNGYRKMPADMHLKYVLSTKENSGGVIQSETGTDEAGAIWKTGSMALSKVVASTPAVVKEQGGEQHEYTTDELRNGTLFAVVLRRDKNFDYTQSTAWHGVYGNQIDGWKEVDDSSAAGIAETIKANQAAGSNTNVFTPNTNGSYEVTVENLPGDIQKYYWMLPDENKNETEYTVAYYYSSASDVNGITADNITRLNSDDFIRQFGASLYVSNIKNQLFVQKVDDEGNPIDKVEFKLYKEDSCPDGACTGEPYDSLTTEDLRIRKNKGENLPGFDGAGVFPNKQLVLPAGKYYLVEGDAPTGYIRNEKLTEITIDDYGVFANAGEKDDGIKVVRGAGYLLKTVSSLGTSPNIDNTLTWIKSKPMKVENGQEVADTSGTTQSAAVDDTAGKIVPSEEKENPLRLDHSATAKPLEYGPREANGDVLYIADEGIPSLYTTQDAKPDGQYPNANRTELGDMRLSALISGTVMVQVTNDRISGSVSWTKVDKDDTETVLGGSKWKLEKSGDNGYTSINSAHDSICDNGYTGDGSESCTVTVDQAGEAGQFTLSGLLPGDYKLTEIEAPKGYAPPPDAEKTYATFTVDNTGNVVDVTLFGDWNTAASGNTTCTPGLESGNCRLTNQREYGPELPETGGNGPMALVWGGLLLAGCGLAGLGYARRRW